MTGTVPGLFLALAACAAPGSCMDVDSQTPPAGNAAPKTRWQSARVLMA